MHSLLPLITHEQCAFVREFKDFLEFKLWDRMSIESKPHVQTTHKEGY